MTKIEAKQSSPFDVCCTGRQTSPAKVPYKDGGVTDDDDESQPHPPPPLSDADGEAAGISDEDPDDEKNIKDSDPAIDKTLDVSDEDLEDCNSELNVEIPRTKVVKRMEAEERYELWKERKWGVATCICCCLLILIAVVLGAGFGTGAFQKEETTTEPSSSNGDKIPPEDVDPGRGAAVTDYLASVNTNGEAAFEDDKSAESLAMSWLASEPLQLDPTVEADQFRLQQRYALLTLYYGSNFQWKDETLWVTGADECQWFGVTCEERYLGNTIGNQNVVVSIELSGNSIQGPLPADVALLTSVTVLTLSNNELGGEIPASIGTMSNLEELNLDRNEFQQNLSDFDFSGMTSLRVLVLSNNQFSGTLTTSIFLAETLEILSLDSNSFTGGIDGISNLSNLRK